MAVSGKNVLIGCGLGCGALAILLVGGCVGFSVWLSGPAEVLESERLLIADASAYTEVLLTLDDPATARVVEDALHQLDRLSSGDEAIPEWIEGLLELQNRRRARQLRKLFPVTAVASLLPSERPGQDRFLLAFSGRSLGNRLVFADWILAFALGRHQAIDGESYRSERLFHLPISGERRLTFFLHSKGLFVTPDFESAKRVVDRLVDPEPSTAQSEVSTLLSQLPADRSLRGAATNRAGELDRLYAAATPGTDSSSPGALAGFAAVTVVGRFNDAGSLEGELRLRCAGRACSEGDLRRLRSRLQADFEERRAMDGEWSIDGEWLLVRFQSRPISEILEELGESLEAPDGS